MKNKLLALVLILAPVVSLWAQVPPPPTQGGNGAGGPGGQDPGTPIDQYTLILFVLAFCLSIYYFLNKQKKTEKS